jgi:DNA polymerase (family 10)
VKRVQGINVEVHVAHDPKELGGHLFMYTGDQIFEIAMRAKAKRHGWKLNQYGLYDAKTGTPIVESPDERDFFDALGVPYHTPEERNLKDRKKKAAMGYFEEAAWE